MINEHHAQLVDYSQRYFDFSRNITEIRANDYRKSLESSLNKQKPDEKKKIVTAVKESKESKESRFSTPLQIFITKCSDENPSLKISEIKSKYYKLNNKKRLKLVKEAEQLYDSIAKVTKMNID